MRSALSILLALLLGVFAGADALADTTGAKYPTANATAAETPWVGVDWATPGNIYSDDGNTANIVVPQFDNNVYSYVIKAYTFDMSAVPSGAIINGVIMRVNAWYANNTGELNLCQLLDTSLAKVGTNQCSTPVALTLDDTTVITKGSSTDKWGNSLTDTWVKHSNFGVALGMKATANNADVFIDYVTLEVYYTDTSPTVNLTGEGTASNKESVTIVGTRIVGTDFSGYTTGQQPTGWTERYNTTYAASTVETGSGIGGKELRMAQDTAGTYGLSWDDYTPLDVELLTKTKSSMNVTGQSGMSYQVRASGTGSSDTGYRCMLNAYDDVAKVTRRKDGANSDLDTQSISISPDTWYWQRFRVTGSGSTVNVKLRVWPDGSAEPGTWLIDYDDTNVDRILDAGWMMTRSYYTEDDPICDYFAYATDGATAEGPLGDAYVNLTGQAAASNRESVAVSGDASISATGQGSASAGEGLSLSVDHEVTLAGLGSASDKYGLALSVDNEITPTGEGATSGKGDLDVSEATNGDVFPTGEETTSGKGDLALSVDNEISVSGEAAATDKYDLALSVDNEISPTGEGVTSGKGDLALTVDNEFVMSGEGAASGKGDLALASGAGVSLGGEATASAPNTVTVSADASISATGEGAASGDGTLTVYSGTTLALTGEEVTSNKQGVIVSADASIAASGEGSASTHGTLDVSAEQAAQVDLTGSGVASGRGDIELASGAGISASGEEASSGKGDLAMGVGYARAVSGEGATSNKGSVAVSADAGLSLAGMVVVASAGDLSVAGGAGGGALLYGTGFQRGLMRGIQ